MADLPDYSSGEDNGGPAAAPNPPPDSNRYPKGSNYPEFEKDLNFWKKYNDPTGNPPKVTLAEVKKYYRIHDYVIPPAGAPVAPQYTAAQPVRPYRPRDTRPTNDVQKKFLAATLQDFMTNEFPKNNWRGVEILGTGSSAVVGHWSYSTNRWNPLPRYTELAVKEADDVDEELTEEGEMMLALGRFSEHVVRLVKHPEKVDAAEGNGVEWEGKVKRLIMEYCSQGTLLDLCMRRLYSQTKFQENTLWQSFDCLADGITVLEHGEEFFVNTVSGDAELARDDRGWVPIVHFDLKPRNILLEKTSKHANTPVIKLADFGNSERIDPLKLTDKEKEEIRRWGTPGYHAPEQFSPRWNYADWKMSGVCGEYCYATNVWGVGIAMWQLVMLDMPPKNFTQPYTPTIPINGQPAKGRSFAVNIEAAPYSKALTDLIIETMYKKVADRPLLRRLKERVTAGLEQANRGQGPELWSSLLVPEPPPPPPTVAVAAARTVAAASLAAMNYAQSLVIPPPAPRTVVFRCNHVFPDGRQCLKMKKAPLGTAMPRCVTHSNLVRYPT